MGGPLLRKVNYIFDQTQITPPPALHAVLTRVYRSLVMHRRASADAFAAGLIAAQPLPLLSSTSSSPS